jgi:hypothetical protein
MKQAELREVYEMLTAIIDNEPKLVPLTDPELAERLSAQIGRQVDKWAVCRWRNKLGIGPSWMRRDCSGDHGKWLDRVVPPEFIKLPWHSVAAEQQAVEAVSEPAGDC